MKWETFKIRDIEITHENYKIIKYSLNGLDIEEYINNSKIEIEYQPFFHFNDKVYYSEEFVSKLFEVFDGIKVIYDEKSKLLSAHLATYVFTIFEKISKPFIEEGKLPIIIKLSEEVVRITNSWEAYRKKEIHKGALYGFLCRIYLLLGNDYSAFSYLYNSLNEDIRLGKECTEINYPSKAPSYLTVTLAADDRNFLFPYVEEIRNFIKRKIKFYNHFQFLSNKGRNQRWDNFDIEKFDEKFFNNVPILNIVFYFVFVIWEIFNYDRNISKELMLNDFSYKKNADLLFSLCLIINLLLNKIYVNKNQMKKAVEEYLVDKNYLTLREFSDDNENSAITKGDLDEIIPDLLNNIHPVSRNDLNPVVSYFYIAWSIRNFAAHDIEKKEIFVKRFDDVIAVLMCLIFLLSEEF